MSVRRHLPPLAATIAVAAVLTGCAPSSGTPTETTSVSAPGQASPEPSAGVGAEGDSEDPPEALGSVSLSLAGVDGIESTLVEVVRMRHVQDALVVTMRLTATGDGEGTRSIAQALGSVPYPTLIDYENLKKYDAVPALTTNFFDAAPIGEPLYLEATFAYPEGAESVDVLVSTFVQPITDVAVP